MSLRSRYRLYHFGNRLQLFFLGFLLGIVLGGGFFLLKLDSVVKGLAFEKTFTDPGQEGEDANTAELNEAKNVSTKKEKVKSADNVFLVDSSSVSNEGDSSLPSVFNTNGDENIVVRKDEMVAQKVVSLINLDVANAADSIRSKEAGIREEPGKSVTVEFWESPLHYTGYKLSRSRLILFGVDTDEQVALYRLDNTMYMKIAGGVFRLENTADFKQLERVTDETLLAKLP